MWDKLCLCDFSKYARVVIKARHETQITASNHGKCYVCLMSMDSCAHPSYLVTKLQNFLNNGC